jgi:hypothetical protein
MVGSDIQFIDIVAHAGRTAYVRAFSTSNPLSMVGLSEFNKLLVLHDNSLYNCPLDSLARITDQGISSQHDVPTLRRVSSTDDHVLFFRTGKVGSRTLGSYLRLYLILYCLLTVCDSDVWCQVHLASVYTCT